MRTKRSPEEVLAILETELKLKREREAKAKAALAPKPKSPSERAQERFAEANKPTERIVADATAHSEALANRLREEREAERRVDYQQALIDRCWAQHRAAQDELEAYGRSLCHRGPGDSDWGNG